MSGPRTEAGKALLGSFDQPDDPFTNHIVRVAVAAIEDQAAATERARIAGLVQAMDGMGYCTSHVEGPCGFRAAVLAAIEGEPHA